jgi:hypothetical protein
MLIAAVLIGCERQSPAFTPVLAPPPPAVVLPNSTPPDAAVATLLHTPIPGNTIPEAEKPVLALPVAPAMAARGMALLVEHEGYAARPEAPDARYSGISGGLGYDWSTVAPYVSVEDWRALPAPAPKRLADTHPYTGRKAQAHLPEVHDIRLPQPVGYAVFNLIDVPRFYSLCKRTYPGFEELRVNARDAILSLVYNRGSGFVGDNRREMRELKPLIAAKDYVGMADAVRRMKRVWTGTSIQHEMYSRREDEARLILTP